MGFPGGSDGKESACSASSYKNWNAKVGSQENLEYPASLALEYKIKQGKGCQFCQENTLVTAKQQTCSSNNIRHDSTHGHHQMANIKIRFIILFTVKDGKDLSSPQKQNLELTMAQIMDSLCKIYT